MNLYLSRKIRTLSFVAIVGVLLMHGTYKEANQWYWLWCIQRFIGTMANSSVPFFFIISGYFFFLSCNSYTDITRKVKKRCKTLLIPYFFWCIMFMLTVALVGLLVQLDTDYFALLRTGQIRDFLQYCFWTPAAFHLWYVRDLFLIVLFSPIIALALKKFPKTTLVCSLLLFGFLSLKSYNIFWGFWWFMLGSFYGSQRKQPFSGISHRQGVILLICGIVAVMASVIWRFPVTPDRWYSIPILFSIIVGVWNLYDLLDVRNREYWICDFTFIIYCAHIPLTHIISKTVHPLLLNNSIGCTIGYIITPVICIGIIVFISKILRRVLPGFYYLITGGR